VTVVDRTALLGGLVHAMAASQSRRAAYAARQEMYNRVPVVSGALKDSIEIIRHGPGEYEIAAGGGIVDYAAAVEFGTYKMSARPYFTPGLEAGRKVMLAGPEKKL
jgi:hypothetical protein